MRVRSRGDRRGLQVSVDAARVTDGTACFPKSSMNVHANAAVAF
ncbi:MAG: hypothetical protein N2653_04840 [Burkholderiales bacterium]|nr:hypothetical protein [Burkholderiales bacterium]